MRQAVDFDLSAARGSRNPIRDSPRATPELARRPRGFDIDNDKRIAEADRAAA